MSAPSLRLSGQGRLLCRRGQDEREIGFETGVLDSTRLAFLLPERTREMTESAQALAEGQEARTGKTKAGGGESAVGKPEPLPVPSQGGQRLINSQARLPRARRGPEPGWLGGALLPSTRGSPCPSHTPRGGLRPSPRAHALSRLWAELGCVLCAAL